MPDQAPPTRVLAAPPRKAAPPPGPCAMVIFGAGGDLTKRLLFPALYNLARTRLIPDKFAIIGVDIADRTVEDWRNSLLDMLHGFVGNKTSEDQLEKIDQDPWRRLTANMSYVKGDLNDPRLYDQLSEHLNSVAGHQGTGGNVLFYLAVADRFFATIVDNIGRAGLAHEDGKVWRRVVVEKPFGHSLDFGAGSERAIAQSIGREPDLPDRPFPGQGNGAKHHGVPVCQWPVRADLEPGPHRPRADHRRRGGRRRASRALL